jgi:hypothetical protein
MPYIGRELDRGNYLKLDDISSSFDGSTTTFNLTNGGNAFYPGSAFSILVVLAGVVQEPEAAYQINQAQITFASAPLAGDQFFCITLGQALGVNTPANGSVNGTQLAKPFNYDNYFYLDDANNRVGVGTATPMTPLHVEGTGRFTDLTVTGDLTVEGTTSTLDTVVTEVDKLEVGANNSTVGVAITQSGTGDILRLYDGASQKVTVTDNGKIGIGINSPSQLLHVNNPNSNAIIQITSSDTNKARVRFGDQTSDTRGEVQYDNANDSLAFKTGDNTEKLRITSTGYVGIGTDTPAANIDVQRSGTGTVARFGVGDGTTNLDIKYSSNTTTFDQQNNKSIAFETADTERLRIASDGSVGIGTDSPQSQFEVFGTSPIVRSKHSTSQKYTQINHNGTDGYLDWSSGGLIFRGASNTERLRITSGGGLKFISADSPTSTTEPAQWLNHSGGMQLYASSGTSTHRNIIFCSASNAASERLRIDSGGAVNIGDVWADDSDPMAYITKNNDVGSIVLKGNGTGTNNAFAIYGGGWSGSTDNKFAIRADGSVWGGQTSLRFGTGSTYTERLRITDGGQVRIGNSTITVSNSADDLIIGLDSPGGDRGATIISGTSGTGNIFFSDTDTSGVGNRMGTITYDHSGNFMRFSTAGNNERLRITSGGNLQVKGGSLHLDSNAELALFEDNTSGTYTNSAKIAFDFSGNVARMRSSVNGSATLRDLAFYTANTAAIYIKTDANVGIGENAPNTRLHIVKDNNVAYTPDQATQNSNNQIKIENHSTTTDSFVSMAMRARACDFHLGVKNNGSDNSGRLFLVHQDTTNKEVVSVLSTGSVGIGTATPDKKLRVEGDARVTGTLTIGEASTVIDGSVEYPTIRPTLDLNFAATKVLDDRIAFRRDSTGTYYGDDGLLKYATNNVPRFDHDPDTGESLGLLIEESSTNLISGAGGYGSDIRNGTSLGNAPTSTVVDDITLPDGTVGQVRRLQIHSSGNSGMRWGSTSGGNANTAYSASVWARATSGTATAILDVNDQGNISYNLTEEWVRMTVTATRPDPYQFMDVMGSAGHDFYLWGFQLENKGFVSSYIPVESYMSNNNRAADLTKITGTNFTDFYNQTEGSTVFEAKTFKGIPGNVYYGEIGRSSSNRNIMYRNTSSGNAILYYTSGGSTVVNGLSSGAPSQVNTNVVTAYAYKENDFGVFASGGYSSTDTSGNVTDNATSFSIGMNNINNGEQLNGTIKRLSYYNKRLPNAQLQGLTQQ